MSTKSNVLKYLGGAGNRLSASEKKYLNRITKIPNITKLELNLSLDLTPSEIISGRTIKKSTHQKRIRRFEKSTGRSATKTEKASLKYATPSRIKKIKDNKKTKARESKGTKLRKRATLPQKPTIEEVKFGEVSWYGLPDDIREGRRDSDSFLYLNSELMWQDNEMVDLDKVLREGVDGEDLTVRGFLYQVAGKDKDSYTIIYNKNGIATTAIYDDSKQEALNYISNTLGLKPTMENLIKLFLE